MWQSKPWWCQPWTIVLTGVVVVAGSWVVLQRWWISAGVAAAVMLWWALFIWIVPKAYALQSEQDQLSESDSD